MIPGSEEKGLCPGCHKFFDPKTGEKVKELAHIIVTHVDEKQRCLECENEREAWSG